MGTAEFPLATTITTSKSPPILAPFRLVINHLFVFLLLSVPWASFMALEQFPGLLVEHELLNLALVWKTFFLRLDASEYHVSSILHIILSKFPA